MSQQTLAQDVRARHPGLPPSALSKQAQVDIFNGNYVEAGRQVAASLALHPFTDPEVVRLSVLYSWASGPVHM
jgi:hypothetical protein